MNELKFLVKSIPIIKWLCWIFMLLRVKCKYNNIYIGYNGWLFNTELEGNNRLGVCTTLINCQMGGYSYIADYSFFNNTSIGRFCSIGPNVKAGCGRHPSRVFVSTSPCFFSIAKQNGTTFVKEGYFDESLPITIGNDVWVGANVFICDGINIGDGAIIGAGSIVTKDVPPYAIVVGVPAKIIRYRFNENQINFLLKDKWWNMSEIELRKKVNLFHNIKKYIDDSIKKG